MAAALNRFISRSSDKCQAFFTALKGQSRRSFKWTPDCDAALANLKKYLTSAPLLVRPKGFETLYLYLAVSPHAVSSALVRREKNEDQPIYFSSKTLLPTQTRYLPLEKVALALVSAARKLLPYFQEHPMMVLAEFPLKNLLRKADLSNRVSQWAVELANFDIQYEPRTAIKAQVLADFIAEFTPGSPEEEELTRSTHDFSARAQEVKTWNFFHGDICEVHVDGAYNNSGSGAGVVPVTPCGVLHESVLTLNFPATNNEAEIRGTFG